VTLLGGATAGYRAVRYELHPRRFAVVEPGALYRSGEIAPRLIRGVLEEHRIRRVVWMLHYDDTNESHRAERSAIEALGIRRVNLHLRGDGTGKPSRYADALAEIADARARGEAVLVQCAAGSRRSGGVVALYELLVERRPPEEAYRELDRFSQEPVASSALLAYLNLHMGEIAAMLAERGVIARVPAPLPQLRPPPSASPWLHWRWALRGTRLLANAGQPSASGSRRSVSAAAPCVSRLCAAHASAAPTSPPSAFWLSWQARARRLVSSVASISRWRSGSSVSNSQSSGDHQGSRPAAIWSGKKLARAALG
jgi:hypothetical protein